MGSRFASEEEIREAEKGAKDMSWVDRQPPISWWTKLLWKLGLG